MENKPLAKQEFRTNNILLFEWAKYYHIRIGTNNIQFIITEIARRLTVRRDICDCHSNLLVTDITENEIRGDVWHAIVKRMMELTIRDCW